MAMTKREKSARKGRRRAVPCGSFADMVIPALLISNLCLVHDDGVSRSSPPFSEDTVVHS